MENKNKLEKRRLVKLNFDDELRDLQQGEMRYALNCRVGNSDNDNQGDIENVKGNVLVSFQLPAGSNKCIGAKEDLANKRMFYFVYNSNGNHGIYEFEESTNSINVILQSSVLNFDKNFLITGINVVGNLLYWTDNKNEPMKIDVEKAKANGYPTPFLVDYIYAIKPPQLCQPAVNYFTDKAKNTNYIKKKLFQFKARYGYDNNEKSVTSPISIVAYPSSGCSAQPYDDNCIQVTVETGNEIVTEIEIFAREVSDINLAQATDFYTITILNKAELGIGNNTTYIYNFYNDKNYLTLDTVRSNQLQDFVPVKAKAQELVDGNRLVYGNIEEGFDPVDVKAKLNVSFEDNINIDTISITGRIYIINPFAINPFGAGYQPIHNNGSPSSPGTFAFGGFDDQNNSTVFVSDTASSYKQNIPLGGFVVYLAGTSYYNVSKQNTSFSYSGLQPTIVAGTGVYQAGNNNERDSIFNAMQNYAVYSTFTISGVTEGSYILRLASHQTTQADIDNNSLAYQKTSTYTSQVAGKPGHEIAISYQMVNGKPQVIVDGVDVSSSVTNNTVTLGHTRVMDLTAPDYELTSTGQSLSGVAFGYVCDKDNGTAIGPAMLNDTRIHLAKLRVEGNTALPKNTNNMLNSSFVSKQWGGQAITYTDHNGYFFIALDAGISGSNYCYGATGYNLAFITSGQTFYQGTTPVTTFSFGQNAKTYYIQNTSSATGSTSVQEFGRTKVIGYVTDNALPNGNPVSNFNVQVTRGGSGKTDSNGKFEIYAYGNHSALDNGLKRNDFACYSLTGGNCFGKLTNNASLVFFNLLGSTTQGYNAIVPNGLYYNISPTPATQVTFTYNAGISLKRGATYEYGIVYYDHGLRNGTTQTKDYLYNDNTHNYGLKMYIPFYTDYQQGTTQIVDSGRPVIDWAIVHTPPIWATHYQWVRTKRGSISNYIQWTLQQVLYIDNYGNTVTFNQATQVKVNLASIVGKTTQGYKAQHADSILTYQFVEGDRMRFIRQNSGSYFPQYYDAEIKGADTTNPLLLTISNSTGPIQLNPGDLVEIYRPVFGNISVEEDIFYEIGECYEIGDAGLPTRYHEKGSNPATTISQFLSIKYKYQNQDTSKTWQYNSIGQKTIGGINYTLLQGTTPHKYNVGDCIVIEQDSQYSTIASFNKTVIVLQVPNNLQVVVLWFYDPSYANFPVGKTYFPATGLFSTGDTFYRLRNIPTNLTLPSGGTSSPDSKWWQIEDENFSDFWVSSWYSIGRPNKVDKQFKRIHRPTTIYYSGPYIPETNINDLNNILDTDFETYERSYGSIQKLHNINRMLDCYQELKVGRIPISQKIWKDAAGSPIAALSDNILNPIDYYAGEYGIALNPESFSVYGYRRYFLDANRGVFLRLSNDGLTPISEHNFKAHNFFTDECKYLTGLGLPFHVYTVYDQKFTEVVVAFEDVTLPDATLYTGKTLSFNEDENTWASFYSYKPDFMVSNDTDIISFKNGELWKHNENIVYNNFYGTQYQSEVWFPVNGEPSKEKVFQAISFEDADAWDVIAECPNGMITDLNAADFELIKNMRYAPFWNDLNTPNTYNMPTFVPRVDGQKMQDYVMIVKLISNKTTFQKLYAVNVLWTPAERSNK